MHWYTFMNTLGRPVEQLAVCLANKQKSAVEVKLQQLCKVSAKRSPMFNDTMSKGHTHTQQTMEAFELFGYIIIRCALKEYSMCVAKPFDSRCKNHSMRVSKAFNPGELRTGST